jgi:hypothetical protein
MLETIRNLFSSLPLVEQREVLLVLLHGQDQALLRHLEVFGFELADIDHRPFDQRRHFVEQAVGRVDARPSFLAAASSCFAIDARRSAKEAMTLPAASRATYSSGWSMTISPADRKR